MTPTHRPSPPSAALALTVLWALAPPVPASARGIGGAEPHPHPLLGAPAPGDGGATPGAGEGLRHLTPCVGGMAGPYPCSNVDLLEHLPLSAIGGGSGNDLWGWTDPLTGREYALMGRSTGTAFVDITDPEDPVYLGDLPSHTGSSTWRDIKVYADHAFIVSEADGHGMQVFDLTQLRSVDAPPVTFAETAHYPGFGGAHNVAIDEASGFAYAVGTGTCGGGLHTVDVRSPASPAGAGCFAADGYTHDAQCVTYAGPDPDYAGREICFAANEDTLTIVDVTDKSAPVQVSRTGYAGSGYTHQGWLTEDHAHFLLDDELDESSFGHNTRTYIWDVADLDDPSVLGTYTGPVASIDHNLYTHNGHVYEANYSSGLRILSLEDVASGVLTEVAYFDTYPASDGTGFDGAWSVYPYFESGTVIVSGIGEGLFVLRPTLCSDPVAPGALTATPAGDNRIDLSWSGGGPGETFTVYRSLGACPGGDFEVIATGLTGTAYSDTAVSGQLAHAYRVTATDPSGLCESAPSGCAGATTTGPCTAPPSFAGLAEVTNPAAESCALELSWPAADPNCGAGVTYATHRSTDPELDPSPANRIASGIAATAYTDDGVASGTSYAYAVRATDTGNGSEDANRVVVTGTPTGPISEGDLAFGAEVGDPPVTFSTPSSAQGERHIGWELSPARAHGGARSYFSTYADDSCIAVVSPPLDLTAGTAPELSFWTLYDIESRWDGGAVQISADGGAGWSLLPLDGGYPGTFRASADACGFLSGDPAFTGTDLTWSRHTADLSPWAGSEVLLRWIFSTDGAVSREGWYVDDVAVSHVQVPGVCSAPAPLFTDGFESGDTSAWAIVVP